MTAIRLYYGNRVITCTILHRTWNPDFDQNLGKSKLEKFDIIFSSGKQVEGYTHVFWLETRLKETQPGF